MHSFLMILMLPGLNNVATSNLFREPYAVLAHTSNLLVHFFFSITDYGFLTGNSSGIASPTMTRVYRPEVKPSFTNFIFGPLSDDMISYLNLAVPGKSDG